MANEDEDYFEPKPRGRRQPAPDPSAQFQGFLEDPRGRAALLQAGLSLLGGRQWGETGLSSAAKAIGSAGEAVRSTEEEQRVAEEASSRVRARGSAAGARAQKLDIEERKLELKAEEQQAKIRNWQDKHDLNRQRYEGQIAVARDRAATAKDEVERKKARDEVRRLEAERDDEGRKIDRDFRQRSIGVQESREERLSAGEGAKEATALTKLYGSDPKIKAIQAENKRRATFGDPPLPVPSEQEWFESQSPAWKSQFRRGRQATPQTTAPSVTPPAVPPAPTQPAPASPQPAKVQPTQAAPAFGDRKRFNQGVGVWDGKTYIPENQFNQTYGSGEEAEEED